MKYGFVVLYMSIIWYEVLHGHGIGYCVKRVYVRLCYAKMVWYMGLYTYNGMHNGIGMTEAFYNIMSMSVLHGII
jgi:hypothetical protein